MRVERKKIEPILSGTLEPGEILVIGKRIYERCERCESVVQINKRIIGALHFCTETS